MSELDKPMSTDDFLALLIQYASKFGDDRDAMVAVSVDLWVMGDYGAATEGFALDTPVQP